MTQPIAVQASMPMSTFLRPLRSPSRGRNSENTAQAVKNTVCVRPISASVVLSSTRIVVNTGESMEALSWNAKMAAINAAISAPTCLASTCFGAGALCTEVISTLL